MQFPYFIIISGPTGVGKTNFVEKLCVQLPLKAEIVNADMGQCYTPLSIGTAKPDYKSSSIKHYLFDILSEPHDYTVFHYRKNLIAKMRELWSRDVIPVVVGGSGFYLSSLFFPPKETVPLTSQSVQSVPDAMSNDSNELRFENSWEYLAKLDPARAGKIDAHDTYRIARALDQIKEGAMPSKLLPEFDPPGRCLFFFLSRDREELVCRINARVDEMIAAGWLNEVATLTPEWRAFLLKKKLIGYPELITYLESLESGEPEDINEVIERIKIKTRAYAKRQMTFWRMLKNKLTEHDPDHKHIVKIEELNLTVEQERVYLDHIRKTLQGCHD